MRAPEKHLEEPSPVVDNIRRLMNVHGLSAREVSRKAGLGNTAVTDILSGNSGSAREITLQKIARVFGCDIRDLFARPHEIGRRHIVPVPIVGAVEAGVWQTAVEWPQDDWQYEPLPSDSRFAQFSRFGFLVRGESMNELYQDGDIVICVAMWQLQEKPVAGRRYVVYRTDREGKIEATLKEYQTDREGHAWLVPRSNDPRFSAPVEITEAEKAHIEIHARVTGSWRRER